jgi:3-oxoacyl-[acyl-carrier-protein] synthase II
VITGLGAVTPIGIGARTYWENLLAGKSGIRRIEAFDPSDLEVQIAGEVRGFDAKDWIDAKAARRMSRFAQFAVATAIMAVEDAALSLTDAEKDDTAVSFATGAGGAVDTMEETRNLIQKGPARVSPFYVPTMAPNMAACQVSMTLGLRGAVTAPVAACASSLYSFIEALRLIRLGEAEVVIAGGTEATISPLALASLGNMKALSHRSSEPERASRPFDRDRDGFVFGEGAAALVIESEEHARQRGARVYAELRGGGLRSDAYHITAPAPEGAGATRAITAALKDGGLAPSDIDYICAHGTGTPLNDVAETMAIKAALGEDAYRVAISSPKSMVGHLLGAAGAVSAVACAYAIAEDRVPPTINLENPDPQCDLDYVPNHCREMPVRAALANGFGFGGQNAVVAFSKPRA